MTSTQREHHPNCRSQCPFAHDRSQDTTSKWYDAQMCPFGHGEHECNCWDLQPGETLEKEWEA